MRLRALELSDIELLFEWENDLELWEVGNTLRPLSHYAIENYILTSQNEDLATTKQMRLMIDLETPNLTTTIGCIDIFDFNLKDSKAAIGIFICQSERHKGYAKQAILQIEEMIKKTYCLHQLYAHVLDTNQESKALFNSCNYFKTATLKDWVIRNNKHINVELYQKILKYE